MRHYIIAHGEMRLYLAWPRGYKKFMLKSDELEIFPAYKC